MILMISNNSTININLNWKKLQAIPRKLEQGKAFHYLYTYAIYFLIGILPRVIKQLKIEGIQIRKGWHQSILICRCYDSIYKQH